MMHLPNEALILFQGDSITAAGREWAADMHLGDGYVRIIARWLTTHFPHKRLRFLNRGISGDRAVDLRRRWQADCLDLQPDWVSIMVGVNDTWRRFDQGLLTTAAAFEGHYRHILQRTRAETEAEIILCTPFLRPYPADRLKWRADLDAKIEVVHRLAAEFDTRLVPLDRAFAQAATVREESFWTTDGVHPTPAGHALIAQEWLRVILEEEVDLWAK
jgi:lysophospholipase L1-like esterase